jgi:predicted metal-dependent hydrolase
MAGLKALWSSRRRKRTLSREPELVFIAGLSILWRKSPRRTRSLALKVDKRGQILAMTPVATRLCEVERFIISRQAWIRRQLAQHQQLETQKQEAKGQSLWVMGEQLTVDKLVGARNLIEPGPGLIKVITRQPQDENQLDRRLTRWLREQAGRVLPSRLEKLSQKTGLTGSGLQIKSYTARWGSCRHDGLIQLNWKLIKTPPEVIDYVIIHELCHLSHFNHSPAFWEQVIRHCPEYKTYRKWLKENGRLLISA